MKAVHLEKFYSRQAKIYDITRSLFLFAYKEAISYLHIVPNDQVLDLACGTGKSTKHLVVFSSNITCIDYSKSLLAIAKKKFPGLHFVQGDVSKYEYNQKFDKIICSYSLSMIEEWKKTIQHTHSYLKEGGIFVILDFGPHIHKSKGLQKIIAWIISLCGVHHDKDIQGECKKIFTEVSSYSGLGGYYNIIVCKK